jgi:hypothetical protein
MSSVKSVPRGWHKKWKHIRRGVEKVRVDAGVGVNENARSAVRPWEL